MGLLNIMVRAIAILDMRVPTVNIVVAQHVVVMVMLELMDHATAILVTLVFVVTAVPSHLDQGTPHACHVGGQLLVKMQETVMERDGASAIPFMSVHSVVVALVLPATIMEFAILQPILVAAA